MANHDWENDHWVDERVAALGRGPEWIPDSDRALGLLRSRSMARTRARALAVRRWVWTTLVAGGAGMALLLLPASRACAQQPGRCVQRVLGTVAPAGAPPAMTAISPAVPEPVVDARPYHAVDRAADTVNAGVASLPTKNNFKETGSASAPVGVEVYIDYECPHCENFVRDVAPLLVEQYVRTGKVRLLYRDFPLATHRYAKLAARYADAAGEIGYYEAAMKQLFATRPEWSANGDVEAEISQVLPAEAMDEVRARIHCDSEPASLSGDIAAGQADHLDRTPFVVIVSNGKREAITSSPLTFDVLKNSLDRLSDQ